MQGVAIVLIGSSGITIAEAFRAHYNKPIPLLLFETHKSLYQAERGMRLIGAKALAGEEMELLQQAQAQQDANVLTASYFENIPNDIMGSDGRLLFFTTAEMQFSNGDYEETRARAELYEQEILEAIRPYETIVLVASLGGTTNTAIAPYVAQLAKRQGKKVETIATMPAQFEGKKRKLPAEKGLAQLLKKSHVTVVEMDAIQESYNDYFKLKDERIVEAIVSFLERT